MPDASTEGTTVGMTQVAIEVRFNGYVQTVVSSELLADLLWDTAKRGGDDVTVSNVSDALGITTTEDKADTTAPATVFRYEAITSMAGMLPQVRDLVNTQAGIETAVPDATPPVVEAAPVATGYATDVDPATGVDRVEEDENGASQIRIGRSSGVKVPATPES